MEDDSPPDSPSASPPTPQALRELRERAQGLLANQRAGARQLEERIASEIARVTEELTRAYDANQADATREAEATLAAQQTKLDESQSKLAGSQSELESSRAELENSRRELDASRGELASDRHEFDSERQAWEALRERIEADLETLRENLQSDADRQHHKAEELASESARVSQKKQELDKWATELADQHEKLETLRRDLKARQADLASSGPGKVDDSALEAERARWDAERRALEKERDALAAAANETAEQLAESRNKLQAWEAKQQDTSDLSQKFELALADVQSLRAHVAELEEQLAERPEAGGGELAQLAQLRAERDELREELAARASQPSAESSDSEEIENLRRRFELAVEDVRQLKTERAELEQRLASAEQTTRPSDADGLDWEAQKRRMLASLEGDGADATPEQREERSTIEGTIRITDEIVAEKDAQIARLLEEISSEATGEAATPPGPPLDDDERLEAERQRLAALEAEWEDKLRSAELELSVERAKIARERAELADLRIDMEAQQKSGGGHPRTPDAPPKRNWLNKLGLGGADEEG